MPLRQCLMRAHSCTVLGDCVQGIPAIETGLLPVNKGNIPLEDDDHPPELAPVEGDPVWRPTVSWPYVPPADGDDHQPPPITPPSHGPLLVRRGFRGNTKPLNK